MSLVQNIYRYQFGLTSEYQLISGSRVKSLPTRIRLFTVARIRALTNAEKSVYLHTVSVYGGLCEPAGHAVHACSRAVRLMNGCFLVERR